MTTWDESEKKRFEQLKKNYGKNSNVILCDSLPSIEFWFLLHFVNTTRTFPTSMSVISQLVKHIPDFDKTASFLKNQKWVEQMSQDGKMQQACSRAKSNGTSHGSYSNVWKAIEAIGLAKNSVKLR